MVFSPQFVDRLCWRLKALGAPKVPWLQISLLLWDGGMNTIHVFDVFCGACLSTSWHDLTLVLNSSNRDRAKVLVFATLLTIWTDIPEPSWQDG